MYLSLHGETTPDATPLEAPDPIAIWQQTKERLKQKFGVYKDASGQIAVVDNKTYPVLTFDQARAIFSAWVKFGLELVNQALAAHRDVASLNATIARYQNEEIDWASTTVSKYIDSPAFQGKYLYLAPVRDLFAVTDRYVRDLSVGQWTAYNIEGAYERWLQALDETPGGWLLKWAFEAGYKTAEALHNGLPVPEIPDFSKWFRYMMYGGLALTAVWLLGNKKK